MYAPPANQETMLVLNTVNDAVYGVDTESIYSGSGKWQGITAVGHGERWRLQFVFSSCR